VTVDLHKREEAARTIGEAGPSVWLAELDSLLNLSQGWDGYSAPAPHPAAVENAKALVIEADTLHTEPEHVGPSAMGGVGVTFSVGDREVVIEFYNNGSAHALFADDATEDMCTRPVKTDRDGCREILGEARKYLYGEKTAH
jgi:hypothetical protein